MLSAHKSPSPFSIVITNVGKLFSIFQPYGTKNELMHTTRKAVVRPQNKKAAPERRCSYWESVFVILSILYSDFLEYAWPTLACSLSSVLHTRPWPVLLRMTCFYQSSLHARSSHHNKNQRFRCYHHAGRGS